MSDKLTKYELLSKRVYAEHVRSLIAKNLQKFESETEGLDYIALTDVPSGLGIEGEHLVFLLMYLFVPEPELFEDGLFFDLSSFLTALHKFVEVARPFAYFPSAYVGDGEL